MPIASSPQCGPSGRADSKNGPIDDRIPCPHCTTTFSRLNDLRRHIQAFHGDESQRRPFKCDSEGCSFSANQLSNLRVHKKTHVRIKDKRCAWPNSIGSPCKFRCSDPSSLNRHIKRHVERAMSKGAYIPMEYRKYVPRIKNMSGYIGVKENNASSSLPHNLSPPALVSGVQGDATSNLNLDFIASPLATGNPYPVTKSPEPAFSYPETAPIAAPPHAFEQPRSAQFYPMDPRANNFPFGFTSNLQDSDEDRFRFHPPPLPTGPTEDEYSIVVRRMKQLVPILAKAKRPLSTEEMKGVFCWMVESRDGFSPERFLIASPLLPVY